MFMVIQSTFDYFEHEGSQMYHVDKGAAQLPTGVRRICPAYSQPPSAEVCHILYLAVSPHTRLLNNAFKSRILPIASAFLSMIENEWCCKIDYKWNKFMFVYVSADGG